MAKLIKTFDTISVLFAEHGGENYLGETVTQLEHALQTAAIADNQEADPAMVVAALLHDIGHLLRDKSNRNVVQEEDTYHENVGHAWLRRHFGQEVSEPVRLHVQAKRYLCSTDPDYRNALSSASVQSLFLQGGPFTQEEALNFEKNPYYEDAIRLRSWDDEAKIPELVVPGLEYYRQRVELLAKKGTKRE